MKERIILIFIFLFCACNPKVINNNSGSGDIIKISDVKKVARMVIRKKHDRDLVIYDVSDQWRYLAKNAYAINVYRTANDITTTFVNFSEYTFEKMCYHWVNDSILKIRFFNTNNQLSYSFTYLSGEKYSTYSLDSINNVPVQ